MPSESAPEPAAWGMSMGRFGSDAAADQGQAGQSTAGQSFGRSRSGQGRRSGSFGSQSSGTGKNTGKKQAGRGQSRKRSPFDDPYGPVVGASADAVVSEVPDGDPLVFEGDSDAGPRRGTRGKVRRTGEHGGPGHLSELDEAGDSEPAKSDEEWASAGRAIMLRQLALGPRSRHQLGQKLAGRSVPDSIASALLDRFEEVQLIDDAEFARIWVRSRAATKALTRSSIRRELADKGVDPDLAEDALSQISDEEELDQARDIVRRKHRGNADLSDRALRDKEIRRLVGVLARKGYNPGAAFAIVKDVMADMEASRG